MWVVYPDFCRLYRETPISTQPNLHKFLKAYIYHKSTRIYVGLNVGYEEYLRLM
jgi:hypothetical protein